MNFSSFKNIPKMYLYLASIISFVLANLVRDTTVGLYYFFLLFGAACFIFGFLQKRDGGNSTNDTKL